MRTPALLFFLALAIPSAVAADDCEGRNPLHCGKPAAEAEEAGVALVPAGGCEGRNPLYCREKPPEKVESEAAPEPRRERRRGESANPNRNPKRSKRARASN